MAPYGRRSQDEQKRRDLRSRSPQGRIDVIVPQDLALRLSYYLQEMLKVRGFQVAPAELEGCILDHPDVVDTCVVGVQDDYSGELPLAFVVLRHDAAKHVRNDPTAAHEIKQSIMKVRHQYQWHSFPILTVHRTLYSTSPTTRSHTRSWREALSSLMLSPRIPVGSC
jgi:acyl-CoA synthetase (AMP-forming)/AMP-acid ligase II